MKRRNSCSIVWILIMILFLVSCGTSTGGPQAWLDWPLDNSSFPLAPLPIQAHASDQDGVAQIEFLVDDTPLITIDSNGSRLSEAIYEWTPPGPGIYTIKARAVDTGGNPGAYAVSKITIGGQSSAIVITQTPSTDPICNLSQLVAPVLQAPAENGSVGTTVHFEWSDTSFTEIGCHPHSWRVDISEQSNFSDISLGFGTLNHLEISRDWPLPAGKCYYWRVLAYVPDDYGPPSATRYFCIPATPLPPTATFTPTTSPVTIITPTYTLTPSVTPSPTTEFIVDTTPPSFFSTGVSPDLILTDSGGCPNYKRTVTVAAAIGDENGLSSVVAYWNIGAAESGQVNLQEGGLGYFAIIGPVKTTGTMNVYITARDTFGNITQSDVMYVTVNNCIQ